MTNTENHAGRPAPLASAAQEQLRVREAELRARIAAAPAGSVVTVPVDLDAADLVAALGCGLPKAEKAPLVRAALARQGAVLLDLRDAQRGLLRRANHVHR
jgi:hypothetical protein